MQYSENSRKVFKERNLFQHIPLVFFVGFTIALFLVTWKVQTSCYPLVGKLSCVTKHNSIWQRSWKSKNSVSDKKDKSFHLFNRALEPLSDRDINTAPSLNDRSVEKDENSQQTNKPQTFLKQTWHQTKHTVSNAKDKTVHLFNKSSDSAADKIKDTAIKSSNRSINVVSKDNITHPTDKPQSFAKRSWNKSKNATSHLINQTSRLLPINIFNR